MSVEGFSPFPIETLGSLVTSMDPSDLPSGLSPDCQDIEFIPGGCRTRPGTKNSFTAIAGAAPSVNSLKTFITQGLIQRVLVYSSDGQLYKGVADTALLTQIQSQMPAGTFIKTDQANGYIYMATSDGKLGKHAPTKYDDATLTRVSTDGPCDGVTAADEATGAPLTIAAAGVPGIQRVTASPAIDTAANRGAVRVNNNTTVTTTAAHGLVVGWTVIIAGVTDATFNGTFKILTVPSATTFTYAHIAPDTVSGGGTATVNISSVATTTPHGLAVGQRVQISGVTDSSFDGSFIVEAIGSATVFYYTQAGTLVASGAGIVTPSTVGSISAGDHQVVAFYELDSGAWTKYSIPVKWTALGGRRATVTGIPTGPTNVVRRRLAFTAANGARFYHLAATMIIDDNATTTWTGDFTDNALLSGQKVDALLTRIVLPFAAGVVYYAGRLLWYGLEKIILGFSNLGFDAGPQVAAATVPQGWTVAGAGFGPGGSLDAAAPGWGFAYKITGDGATAVRGEILQTAVFDRWTGAVPLIRRQTSYTVRARIKKSAGLVAGSIVIDPQGTGIADPGLNLTAAQVTTSWATYEAVWLPAKAAIPADLMLRVYAAGTPTNGQSFWVDDIRILPTAQLNDGSTVYGSLVDDGDTYDSLGGLMTVDRNDGQELRGAFKLREFLYFVKERGLHVTQDDGINSPSGWTVTEVDPVCGTPSVNGWAKGEGFAIIANRTGLYYFNGGIPTKVSPEIQPTWDRINWGGAGNTVWVTLDPKRRRALIGVPMDGALSPNKIIALDYAGTGEGGPQGAMLNNPLENPESGRKWTIWNLAMNCGDYIETLTGPRVMLGNSVGNGKVYTLDFATKNDDGAAINSYWRSHFVDSGSSGRDIFGFMTGYFLGSGTFNIAGYFPGDYLGAQPLGTFALNNPAQQDTELGLDMVTERASFKIGTNAAEEWFQATKLVVYRAPDPWGIVKGK